ncbi:MAG: hypothetical protein ACYDDF_12670 [Thermoplasmatota archaeon]
MRPLLAVSLLAILALPPLASADTLLATVESPGGSWWVAWKIQVPGGNASFGQSITGTGPMGLDWALKNNRSSGGFAFGWSYGSGASGVTTATVQLSGAPVVSTGPTQETACCAAAMGVSGRVGNASWTLIQMGAAAPNQSMDFRLVGSDGIKVLGMTEGPAVYGQASDFRGDAVVTATAGAPLAVGNGAVQTSEARIISNAHLSIPTRHQFMGLMIASASSVSAIQYGYSGPNGSVSGPVWCNPFGCSGAIFVSDGPGRHAFRIDRDTDVWGQPIAGLGAEVSYP